MLVIGDFLIPTEYALDIESGLTLLLLKVILLHVFKYSFHVDKPEPIAQPVVTQPISIPVFQPISQPVVAQPVVSDPIPVPVDSLITGPMFQVKVSEKSLKIRDSTSLVDVEFIITKENELVFRVTATKVLSLQLLS